MNVLIRDMKMPKRCGECSIVQKTKSAYRCPLASMAKGFSCVTPFGSIEIPVYCHLVPVQPHGRLIDADALLMRINHEVMEAYMDGVCYGVHPNQEYLYLLGEIIDDAPTIIPASKEDEL